MAHLSRTGFFAAIAAIVLVCAGCTANASPLPAASASAQIDELCADSIVVTCERGAGSLLVTVAGSASTSDTVALGGRLYEVAAGIAQAGEASLEGGATLQAEPRADAPSLDAEVSTPPPWQLRVYPGVAENVETNLTRILDAAAIPGISSISLDAGWPTATIADLGQFDTVFAAAASTPLFAAGGTYTLFSLDEHLRIVHVPERTADVAIFEIIDIARAYPDAEVLLEATTTGPQAPTFYVSRLTPEQVIELDQRLRDPRLAGADVDGYPLEFVLGSIGPDGTAYTSGTFGDVAPQ